MIQILLLLRKSKMKYCYYFKESYYFRKRINPKFLCDRNNYLIYRRSLKVVLKDPFLYKVLEESKNGVQDICSFINEKLTAKFRRDGEMEVTEVSEFIDGVCDDYMRVALAEGTLLEDKRVSELGYTDEEGSKHLGYNLQALSVEYKSVVEQINTLDNSSKSKKRSKLLAHRIMKRTNISFQQVLEQVPADSLNFFYEKLIKNERRVLENDILRYFQRNLHEVRPIVENPHDEPDRQAIDAFYTYLRLVTREPLQKDYFDLIKKNAVKKTNSGFFESDREKSKDFVLKVAEELKKLDAEKVKEVSLDISALIDGYVSFKKSTDRIQKRQRNSLQFLSDYLKGDGEAYEPKTISEVTLKDVQKLCELLVNSTHKGTAATKDMNLFQLVDYRKRSNAKRYATNTVSHIETDIKDFWKYLCKYKMENLNRDLFDGFNLISDIKYAKEDHNEEDRLIRRFSEKELQIFIDKVYEAKNLKKNLLDQPRNVYCFFFGFMLGLRISEFLYIRTSDINVQEKDGQRVYYIYLNADVPPQRLKNKNAHRNIPIPETLIDLGFLNYVALRKKRGKEWLWDYPTSGSNSTSSYIERYIGRLFPECVKKMNSESEENYLQFRSLRKNFANYLANLEEKISGDSNYGPNFKRLIGHEEGTSTGRYLGRLSPIIGKNILDSLGDYGLDLSRLKNDINNHYREIQRDLMDLKDNDEHARVSKVKAHRRRAV